MSSSATPLGRSSSLGNLLLAAVSLAVTLVALEAGVRLFVDLEQQRPFAVYDVDHANRGLSFLPGRTRHYETAEFRFDVHYNAFGRRDVEWSPAVVADPANVMFIGDSNVYGIGVEDAGTLPSQLEAHFARAGRPVEVMNFGMPGSGAPPTYALLLDDAIRKGFGARTILVGLFIGNDFYPDVLEAVAPKEAAPPAPAPERRPSLLSRSKLYQLLAMRVSQSARLVGWSLTLGRLLGISVYDSAGTYVFLREQTPEQEALFARILGYLGEMKRHCDEDGRRLVALILPNRIQVENREALSDGVYDAGRAHRDILRYCDQIGVACLDLLPVLSEAYERDGEALFYPVDRHMNPRGYRVAADAIADFLRGQGLL